MNRLKSGMILIMSLSLTVSAIAQSKPVTMEHARYVSNVQAQIKNPAFHRLHLRMRQILEKIQVDLKINKINQSQATELYGKIKVVRNQELNWIKESSTRTLTTDQIAQINQQLDPIANGL